MHDIDPVMYELYKQQQEMKKQQEKYQKKVERREKILFFVKWFGLGLLVGTVITFLTSCGSASAPKSAETAQAVEAAATEGNAQHQSPRMVPETVPAAEQTNEHADETTEPDDETTEPVEETTEPAKTEEHTTVDATWHESTKTHDDLNVNSALKFEDKLIWNFSDCTAVGKSATEDVVTATEADYGFVIKVIDDNTVMVDPYDNSDTGIVPVAVNAELSTGNCESTESADTYTIRGYAGCGNGLGFVRVTFSDDIILKAGVFKENGRLYAVNINNNVGKATRIINCRLDLRGLMDKAGITEADAVYTDPIYYPIVPANKGEATDTDYWLAKSSEIAESDWSDAHKVMAFYNYIIDNFAYDDWVVARGEHSRWFYYNDFTGKYYISQTRVGVCEDFAQVFAIMCRAQGIPALEIHNGSHAMAAAYIEDYGRWVLVDTTVDMMHDAYQEDYTVWTDARKKRYEHLNDVYNTNFAGIAIGNYEDMKNFGIPTYD